MTQRILSFIIIVSQPWPSYLEYYKLYSNLAACREAPCTGSI